MATKIAVHNENAPDLRTMFNWGVKVRNFSELFIITGHGEPGPDFQIKHPGDPVAQTRDIFTNVKSFLEKAGYTFNDLISFDMTVTKEVTPEQQEATFGVIAEFFADVEVKPAGGTLRVVEALAVPGMLVEYEFLAAK